jgi:hypothetical protein
MNMSGWRTIYIKGTNGYQDVLRFRLDDTWLSGTSGSMQNLMMFWLSDSLTLKDLKRAIGSKSIFKYRLQFFTTLEEHHQSELKKSDTKLSLKEEAMILEMEAWEKTLSGGLPSGRASLDNDLLSALVNSRNDN